MVSAAYGQYVALINKYTSFLPKSTFPWIPLIIAAVFQVFAWFGGRFLGGLTMIPRVFVLWFLALGEYAFMSVSMNASTEVLKMNESLLVVIYQVATLVVFIIINSTVFRNKFKWKYLASFVCLGLAVFFAYM